MLKVRVWRLTFYWLPSNAAYVSATNVYITYEWMDLLIKNVNENSTPIFNANPFLEREFFKIQWNFPILTNFIEEKNVNLSIFRLIKMA